VLNELEQQGLSEGRPLVDTLRDRLAHIERLEADIKTRGLA
jgi:hypothetical protein